MCNRIHLRSCPIHHQHFKYFTTLSPCSHQAIRCSLNLPMDAHDVIVTVTLQVLPRRPFWKVCTINVIDLSTGCKSNCTRLIYSKLNLLDALMYAYLFFVNQEEGTLYWTMRLQLCKNIGLPFNVIIILTLAVPRLNAVLNLLYLLLFKYWIPCLSFCFYHDWKKLLLNRSANPPIYCKCAIGLSCDLVLYINTSNILQVILTQIQEAFFPWRAAKGLMKARQDAVAGTQSGRSLQNCQ